VIPANFLSLSFLGIHQSIFLANPFRPQLQAEPYFLRVFLQFSHGSPQVFLLETMHVYIMCMWKMFITSYDIILNCGRRKIFWKADKLKTRFQRKLLKTVVYRLTASSLAQMLSWVFFRRVEVNVVVLVVDLIQMGYYFFFESVWSLNNCQVEAMKKRINFAYDGIRICRALLRQRGYSDNAIKEIWKWYDFS